MLHLVSIHSFIFHGIMLYLGLLINLTNYIERERKDIIYYSTLVGIICIIAYIVNKIFGSNLMFISENFPGTFIEFIYNFMGSFFTIFMILAQMFLPFYVIYGIIKIIERYHKRKINVIFGGSFNPPHKFHFLIAKQVLKQYKEVEKVIFVPVNSNYPKDGLTENKHRYNMLKIAIAKNNRFLVSDIDMRADSSLPTVEVLEQMQKQFQDKEIWTLMGSDNLKEIHTWDRAEELVSKYKIIIMERNQNIMEDIINENELLKRYKINFKKLNKEMSDISSTKVREDIKNRRSIKHLVPEEVYEYIEENKLYRR